MNLLFTLKCWKLWNVRSFFTMYRIYPFGTILQCNFLWKNYVLSSASDDCTSFNIYLKCKLFFDIYIFQSVFHSFIEIRNVFHRNISNTFIKLKVLQSPFNIVLLKSGNSIENDEFFPPLTVQWNCIKTLMKIDVTMKWNVHNCN